MRHTIEVGDKLVANMICYNLRVPFTKKIIFSFYKPERGEVIVFDNPKNESISFVKRLIGVPGDIIEVTDGFITVNGKALKTNLTDEARENLDLTGGVYQETNHRGVSYQVRRLYFVTKEDHTCWVIRSLFLEKMNTLLWVTTEMRALIVVSGALFLLQILEEELCSSTTLHTTLTISTLGSSSHLTQSVGIDSSKS